MTNIDKIKIFLLIVIAISSSIFIYNVAAPKGNKKDDVVKSDALKFKEEYEKYNNTKLKKNNNKWRKFLKLQKMLGIHKKIRKNTKENKVHKRKNLQSSVGIFKYQLIMLLKQSKRSLSWNLIIIQ